MAIIKILCMKDSGDSFHSRHLKKAIEYITKPEKTQNGRLIAGINCIVDMSYEQMKATKRNYGKIDKRQGYHIIISFIEKEVSPDDAFEFTYKFVKEYLESKYEVVFAVHDNTENVHVHIIFNSVSFLDGKKYHYKKGDWEKDILPIVNRLCEEYGLHVLNIDEQREKNKKFRNNNNYYKEENIFKTMIKRDIDTCCIQAENYGDFLNMLIDKGYKVKQGKYLAIKPPCMQRFRRCKSLGDEYSEASIREKIKNENLSCTLKNEDNCIVVRPRIVKCYVKRYRRAKLSGLQKKYYRKLYQTGKMRKMSYSQVWKYKDDIRKMYIYQQQYLFLAKHGIHTLAELVETVQNFENIKSELKTKKADIYKQKANFKSVFRIAEKMKDVEIEEKAFQNGDNFFENEHMKWIKLEEQLKIEGYSYEKINEIKDFYKEQLKSIRKKENILSKKLLIGNALLKEVHEDIKKNYGLKNEETKQKEVCNESLIKKGDLYERR